MESRLARTAAFLEEVSQRRGRGEPDALGERHALRGRLDGLLVPSHQAQRVGEVRHHQALVGGVAPEARAEIRRGIENVRKRPGQRMQGTALIVQIEQAVMVVGVRI